MRKNTRALGAESSRMESSRVINKEFYNRQQN